VTDKNWKEAKPKWVVEAAIAEMAAMRLTLALRWPQEAEPSGIFGFGDYDRPWGEVRVGTFWISNGHTISNIEIRKRREDEPGYAKYLFSDDGRKFSNSVPRGHVFELKKDAALHCLWRKCRDHARALETAWDLYEAAK